MKHPQIDTYKETTGGEFHGELNSDVPHSTMPRDSLIVTEPPVAFVHNNTAAIITVLDLFLCEVRVENTADVISTLHPPIPGTFSEPI